MIEQFRFASIIKDLEMYYEHKLSDFHRDQYYDRLSHFDEKALRDAVKYLYDTHAYKRFPMISEIRDAAYQAMKEWQTTEDLEDDSICEACGGIGRRVEHVIEDDGYGHSTEVFCECKKGRRLKQGRKEYFQNKKRGRENHAGPQTIPDK